MNVYDNITKQGNVLSTPPKFSAKITLPPSQDVPPASSMPISSAPTSTGLLETQHLQPSNPCTPIRPSVPPSDNLRSQSVVDPNVMGAGLTPQRYAWPSELSLFAILPMALCSVLVTLFQFITLSLAQAIQFVINLILVVLLEPCFTSGILSEQLTFILLSTTLPEPWPQPFPGVLLWPVL